MKTSSNKLKSTHSSYILCGTILTQVSDVEDEINGLLTYDRKVCKVDEKAMTRLAVQLNEAFEKSCN